MKPLPALHVACSMGETLAVAMPLYKDEKL